MTIDAETAETDRPKGIPTARTARQQNNTRRRGSGVRVQRTRRMRHAQTTRQTRRIDFFGPSFSFFSIGFPFRWPPFQFLRNYFDFIPPRHTRVRSRPCRRGGKVRTDRINPKDAAAGRRGNTAFFRPVSRAFRKRHKTDKKRGYSFCFPHK